jgi:hypothetical protein
MGYETTLIFINDYKKKFEGYCSVEATLKMGCIAYGVLDKLLTKIRDKRTEVEEKEMQSLVSAYESQEKRCFTNGEYGEEIRDMPEKERKKEIKKLYAYEKKLKTLPYTYYNSCNSHQYTDIYGDLLLLVELKELRDAMVKEQARLISSRKYEYGYRRFKAALLLVEHFMSAEDWTPGTVKVVMWGH